MFDIYARVIVLDFLILLGKHLHGSELVLDGSFDLETISEEYIPFLSEDREDELVIVFETIREVFERHDRILHLLSEKSLLEKIIELDLIEFSDDEDIDNIVCGLIAEVENRFRDRDKVEIFASLEEFLDR